ncbi:hypothetical protein OH77DRAFT_928625 [Trametes cingulata]|nr:hypothetical protein OH77DRAFT_928625 [Trametes cingulata]
MGEQGPSDDHRPLQMIASRTTTSPWCSLLCSLRPRESRQTCRSSHEERCEASPLGTPVHGRLCVTTHLSSFRISSAYADDLRWSRFSSLSRDTLNHLRYTKVLKMHRAAYIGVAHQLGDLTNAIPEPLKTAPDCELGSRLTKNAYDCSSIR